ncbi:MAG TPA: SDR family NAD(P)-dependent oxidoreductase [Solirubrobacteraceae bacterium]|nr:SDR family NAD(P)-dependent oxidoreductase [Solirubrobacteraceae bacterium]
MADRLTHEGATVVGVDRREHSGGAHSRRAELTDEDQVREVFASIKNHLGRIDVLYNDAGLNDRDDHSVLDMPLAVWERVLAANLTTTFLCCKHAIPYLLDNDPRNGSVINTASPAQPFRSTAASPRPSRFPPDPIGRASTDQAPISHLSLMYAWLLLAPGVS